MNAQGETRESGDVSVPRHHLGESDLAVFPVALGAASFGWTHGPGPAAELLDAFVDLGGTLVDTADKYASGLSEHIIGTWMSARKNRHRVQIATKIGRGDEFPGLSADSIRRAVEASLERLHTDYIDVLYFHGPDPRTPLLESLAAVEDLINAGKVRTLGASNFPPELLLEARINASSGLPRFEACALEYSLVRREVVTEYEPLLGGQGLALMPYFVLAHGFLGNLRGIKNPDERDAKQRRAASFADRRGSHVLKVLDDVAAAHRADVATVALAWALQHHGVGAAAVGVETPAQLEQLMQAPMLPLTRAQVAELTDA